MGFRLNHMKVGPFRVNLSAKQGTQGRVPVSSVSLPIAGTSWRLWSRDGSRGLTSIDTPGQGSIRLNPETRRQRGRRADAQAKAEQDIAACEASILAEDQTSEAPEYTQYAPLSYDPTP